MANEQPETVEIAPAAKRPQPAPADKPLANEKPRECSKEIGGRDGPEPTRYGDWEVRGIVSDF
jgi:hypothetical protein